MELDLVTMSLATAVVVIVAGLMFLLDALRHAASAAARAWTVSFLAGILTTFCYLVWALGVEGAWIATAIGNGAFTLSMGCLWLGCRRFNDHATRVPGIAAAGVAVAAALAAFIAGPDGGDWAGAAVMFAGIAGFAALGAVESRRGTMGRQTVAIAVTVVFALAGAYYTARTVVFLVAGSDSGLFRVWFGTPATSFLTIALTIVAVVAMSVLRATEATLRGRGVSTTLGISGDGLFDPRSFEAVLGGAAQRAQRTGERVAVIALRMDDLPRITTAFGTHEAGELVRAWRTSVLHAAPLSAFVGEEGPSGVMVALPVGTRSEARLVAARLHQRVVDDLAATSAAVTPVIGVGLALTDITGPTASTLIDASNEAARRSAEGLDAAVVVAS